MIHSLCKTKLFLFKTKRDKGKKDIQEMSMLLIRLMLLSF